MVAGRWSRFMARFFDLWWQSIVVGFFISLIIAIFSPRLLELIMESGSSYWFSVLCLPMVWLFDAMIYSIAGNTPGKAILGLKVTTMHDQPLSFRQYVGRNFSLWIGGLALSIPIISLFTLGNQYVQLGKGKPATYDTPHGFIVKSTGSGWLRKLIFTIIFVAMFVAIAASR